MPQFRRLVDPIGHRAIVTPIVYGMGDMHETPEEAMTRLEREIAIGQARGTIEDRAAFTGAELSRIQKEENDMLRKMQSEMKRAMIRTVANQLAFDAALNAIPVAGAVLSVIMGKITGASGEQYKKRAERDVTKIRLEMGNYRDKRMQMVEDTLSKVYDQEYLQAERAAIALITEQVMRVPSDALAGLDGWLSSLIKNPFKAIKDVVTSFVDDISGKSSYEAAVKQARTQQTKANSQIKTLTERQIVESKSPHGRTIMRTSIVNMLVQSPQFKRLAELMLTTRRERLKAGQRASLGKKLAIGAGVAALAYGASKVL